MDIFKIERCSQLRDLLTHVRSLVGESGLDSVSLDQELRTRVVQAVTQCIIDPERVAWCREIMAELDWLPPKTRLYERIDGSLERICCEGPRALSDGELIEVAFDAEAIADAGEVIFEGWHIRPDSDPLPLYWMYQDLSKRADFETCMAPVRERFEEVMRKGIRWCHDRWED